MKGSNLHKEISASQGSGRDWEPLHEWAVIYKTAPRSLNFLKIVITASSPQTFKKTCNSLQKQLTKACQVITLYQTSLRGSSLDNLCLNVSLTD